MFKDKKTIIFDVDGTLVDSIGMWNDVDKELVIRGGGIPRDTIGEERDTYLAENTTGDIYMGYVDYLRESYNLNLTVEELNYLRNTISLEYLKNHIDLKPGVDLLLKTLKERGYTLVLATIGSRWVVDIYLNENKNILEKVDLKQIFENNILTKDNVHSKKPNPEIYLKAMEITNSKPEECLVIEDSLSGVQAAKNAGIDVVCIYDKYSNVDRVEIERISDYNVSNFSELSNQLSNSKQIRKVV